MAHSFCTTVKPLSEPKKRHQDSLMSKPQVLQSVFPTSSELTYSGFSYATPPHVQVHHCMWLSFIMPSTTLIQQVSNTGVRSPGCDKA